MATTEEIERALKTVLTTLGYNHVQERPGASTHDVTNAEGAVVVSGTAEALWAWARERDCPVREVRPGQVRVGFGPYGSHSPFVLVGAPASHNGRPMFWVYRRDNGDTCWRRVKAYGPARIARTWPVVKSEGISVPV